MFRLTMVPNQAFLKSEFQNTSRACTAGRRSLYVGTPNVERDPGTKPLVIDSKNQTPTGQPRAVSGTWQQLPNYLYLDKVDRRAYYPGNRTVAERMQM